MPHSCQLSGPEVRARAALGPRPPPRTEPGKRGPRSRETQLRHSGRRTGLSFAGHLEEVKQLWRLLCILFLAGLVSNTHSMVPFPPHRFTQDSFRAALPVTAALLAPFQVFHRAPLRAEIGKSEGDIVWERGVIGMNIKK